MLIFKKRNTLVSCILDLEDQLNQKHPLYQLANLIQWQRFDTAFAPLYCANNGRPAKPITHLWCHLLFSYQRQAMGACIYLLVCSSSV